MRCRTNERWPFGAPIFAILLGTAGLLVAQPSLGAPTKAASPAKKKGDGHAKKGEKPKAPTHRPAVATSQEPIGPLPAAPAETRAERITLPNGLSLVLAPTTARESVTVALVVRSGAALDPKGKAGVSAVAAEVMRLDETSLARAVVDRAGSFEVDVARDRVGYVITLPPHELELAMAAHAARIDPIHRTTGDALDAARAALLARDSDRAVSDRLESMVFQGFAPYEVAALGSPADRAALVPADVDAFVADSFVPARTTVVVTGRFDRARALELSKKWLEPLGARPPRPPSTDKLEEQTNQRAADLSVKGAPTTLLYGWALPQDGSKIDRPKLEALAALLAGGPSSRLARALSESGGTIDARIEDRDGPGLFVLRVEQGNGADPGPARKAIEAALAGLGKELASPTEIERVKRATWASHLARISDPSRSAIELATADLESEAKRDALSHIDGAGLRDVASKYLGPLRRTVVTVRDGEMIAKPRAVGPSSEMAKRGNSTKAEPTKTMPTKTEPTKTEPTKTEPTKTEPTKTEPVKGSKTKPTGNGSPSASTPRATPNVDPKTNRHPAKKKGP